MTSGATDYHTRRYLVLHIERLQLISVLVHELAGRPPDCIREPRQHGGAGEIGRRPELDLGGRKVNRYVATQPAVQPVAEQAANMVHMYMGNDHIGYGCVIDAGGFQSRGQ